MREYKWYFFGTCSGTPTAGGPHSTESQAREAAYAIRDFDSEPEFFRFRTVQLSEAKRMYRYQLSQRTGNMGLALRPIRSRKSESQDRDISKGIYD